MTDLERQIHDQSRAVLDAESVFGADSIPHRRQVAKLAKLQAQHASLPTREAKHALEIVKPGRGSWLAGCRCGHRYRKSSGAANGIYWSTTPENEREIRALHREHKAGLTR